MADGAGVPVPRADDQLVVLDVVEGGGEVDAGEAVAAGRRPDQLIQGGTGPLHVGPRQEDDRQRGAVPPGPLGPAGEGAIEQVLVERTELRGELSGRGRGRDAG